MLSLSRKFWMLIVIALIMVQLFAVLYKSVALGGILGEKALIKYEKQMKGRKTGVISVLIGGRGEFFSGL